MLPQKTTLAIEKNKEFLLGLILAFSCFFLSYSFPASNDFQNITKSFFFLFIAPVLFIKVILKKTLSDFGLNLKNKFLGTQLSLLLLLLISGISVYLLGFSNLEINYQLPNHLFKNFWAFLVYELFFVNFTFFLQDFFFSGFLLFLLLPRLGSSSVFLSASLYFLISIFLKGFSWPLVIMSVFLLAKNMISQKTGSFVYGYAISALFYLFLDAYFIHLYK